MDDKEVAKEIVVTLIEKNAISPQDDESYLDAVCRAYEKIIRTVYDN